MQDASLINGLLAKRQELSRENAELRERIAVLANDIEAIDRVLDAYVYRGELVGQTPRQARIVLFYRNELRDYPLAELRKASEPLTSRQLALPRLPMRGERPEGPAVIDRRDATGGMRAQKDAGCPDSRR